MNTGNHPLGHKEHPLQHKPARNKSVLARVCRTATATFALLAAQAAELPAHAAERAPNQQQESSENNRSTENISHYPLIGLILTYLALAQRERYKKKLQEKRRLREAVEGYHRAVAEFHQRQEQEEC